VPELLKITGLNFSYGTRSVLRDLSFSLNAGEILAVLGPNGAGKTTLLKCLLQKEKASSGNINVMGKDLSEYSGEKLATVFSYVPQETGVPFPYTVLEIIMMGRYPHYSQLTFLQESDRGFINDILKKTDTLELKERPFNELSGGEKQRVLVARSLVQDAEIILLDEPTSNLDIRHITDMLRILLKRKNETGKSILFITHDVNLASSFADRAILMKNGTITNSGTVQEILTLENIRNLYETDISIIKDPEKKITYFGYNIDPDLS
jgi:cobalamin transport system ATP-binding protein